MKAIIPVAGKGTRMYPHTLTTPKVLLPVARKNMLSYIIDELIANDVLDVIFIIGYLGEMIREYVEVTYPQLRSIFVEQKEMLGLGHAIYQAKPHVDADEEVFIILGDTLFDVHFDGILSTEYSNLGVKSVENPSRFGVGVLKNGFFVRLVEKPKEPVSNLALVGLYRIRESQMLFQALEEIISKNIRTSNEYQLTDALQYMIDHGVKFAPFYVDNWYDCGKPETLLQTMQIMLDKEEVDRKIRIGFDQSLIIPPVYIGENVTIRNSIIGPYARIGDYVKIENSLIRHAIIGNHARVSSMLLENSIMGDHASCKGKLRQVNLGQYSEFEE